MLYDPKWEHTKVDPLTLPALVAWLELQPAQKIYCYTSPGSCLLAQYLKAAGYRNPLVSRNLTTDGWRIEDSIPVPDIFHDIAIKHPRTFGAALNRARSVID